MKRRTFGLLAGVSAASLRLGIASAQTTRNPALLTTTLTPMGGERAGNADGSIPAWTGGYTTVPAGWTPNQYMPDLFADEQPVVVIDSSNMAQHAAKLSEGVQAMITKYGFSLKVYPTHRTAAAPQGVYDNIAKNVTTAQLFPGGGRLGFTGAFGGIPFPIPDVSDPLAAGAEIIWNNDCKWNGYAYTTYTAGYVVNDGSVVMTDYSTTAYDFPYYRANGSLATFNGMEYRLYGKLEGPPNFDGQESLTWNYTTPVTKPEINWEVLSGQGRVRKAPEVQFDTPSQYLDGVTNYDEYYGFSGSLEKYDWKCLGKQEMYIPYNNNAIYLCDPLKVHLTHFLDPDIVRWELHRVWVVEATLHPGERNVLAKRRFYVDEDTFIIGVGEAWDANGNLFHVYNCYNYLRPDLPGVIFGNNSIMNLQTDDWGTTSGWWNQKAHPYFYFHDSLPDSIYNPQNMAAESAY
jgi:hypothetical protein